MATPGYYPFGMALGSTFSASEANRLMYNGKELQNYDLGGLELGWYDYHARFYDPAIARWHTMDPLAEKYNSHTPYNYVVNNPLRFIDPTGMDYVDAYGSINRTGAASVSFSDPADYASSLRRASGDANLNVVIGNTAYLGKSAAKWLNEIIEGAVFKSGQEGDGGAKGGNSPAGVGIIPNNPFTGSTADGRTYFEGVRVRELNVGKFNEGAAMTIPNFGIIIGKSHKTDIELLRHEFGHILQYNLWGSFKYWTIVVPTSLFSASFNDWDAHMQKWTEWSANRLSYEYFGRPSDWDTEFFRINPSMSLSFPPFPFNY
jgi:RHS repeat-associated protein